jgi:hypothetical protein
MISSRLPDTGRDSGNVMRRGDMGWAPGGAEAGESSDKRGSEEDIAPHYRQRAPVPRRPAPLFCAFDATFFAAFWPFGLQARHHAATIAPSFKQSQPPRHGAESTGGPDMSANFFAHT